MWYNTPGGDDMTIYEKVAQQHNTTPEEVEKEIRHALEVAHIDMDPEAFIVAMAAEIIRG